MSHFTVAVFHREDQDIEELLAPFDETIEYEPYIKYTKKEAIQSVRKDIEDYKNTRYAEYLADPKGYEEKCSNPNHIQYLREEFPKKLNWTDEQCYEYKKEYFEDNMIDEEGNLYSTYNPNSKWDWYVVGGRWRGKLINKNGKLTDEDYVSELVFPDDFSTFAVLLPDGSWHEAGEMGWWAIVSNEKDDWYDTYKEKFLDTADPNWILTIVDCHI